MRILISHLNLLVVIHVILIFRRLNPVIVITYEHYGSQKIIHSNSLLYVISNIHIPDLLPIFELW